MTYYVWRRHAQKSGKVYPHLDNRIDGSVYKPRPYTTSGGVSVTFEHLGEFSNWDEAYFFIKSLRKPE